ncbi:MAG: U32 family peptidase [Bacilli bacterium]|nr:U32 family peptidase [Bacilli bacterium]
MSMILDVKKIEVLAPVGSKENLLTAIHFKADAVYLGGKKFGLRAFGSNFDYEELKEAVEIAHSNGVKLYVTVNILAHNSDLDETLEYLKYLDSIHVDAVIVSDLGIASLVKAHTNLELHVSTQANITNKASALTWVSLGAKRLVLARELSISEIKEIKEAVGEDIDIECFCHGAMCISYSGRCQLSNYFVGRDSNKGECIQPCRWKYEIHPLDERTNVEGNFPIEEDERGTYILNSKDMCLAAHIGELIEAGITSFKIEGRMKSPYYVATTVNTYRRAIDAYLENKEAPFDYVEELEKTSHRPFTTGFYFGATDKTYVESSQYTQSHEFSAIVLEDSHDGKVLIRLRNRCFKGDTLEVLSPTESFNKTITLGNATDEEGNVVEVFNKINQHLIIETDVELKKNDILRKRVDHEIKRQ